MSADGAATPVRLRPELLDDVAEAFAWYKTHGEGIGQEFADSFFAAVAQAARQHRSARIVYRGFRRVRLRRFPHSLYYLAADAEIVFFLLFHAARDPRNLRRALLERRSTARS